MAVNNPKFPYELIVTVTLPLLDYVAVFVWSLIITENVPVVAYDIGLVTELTVKKFMALIAVVIFTTTIMFEVR